MGLPCAAERYEKAVHGGPDSGTALIVLVTRFKYGKINLLIQIVQRVLECAGQDLPIKIHWQQLRLCVIVVLIPRHRLLSLTSAVIAAS
jgi:hypothetical protein